MQVHLDLDFPNIVNVFFLPYDFLDNIFFSPVYFSIRIQNNTCNIQKCANCVCHWLSGNSRLISSCVLGSQKLHSNS